MRRLKEEEARREHRKKLVENLQKMNGTHQGCQESWNAVKETVLQDLDEMLGERR